MCKYDDQEWTCDLCGTFQHGPSPCCECGGDERKATQIKRKKQEKREKNFAPVPRDTHNSGLFWDCGLCGARNYGDTGAKPCWQCQDDPEKAGGIVGKRGLRK